ncbi:MAG TPA: glycosyltransferase [Acidimicrobiales bacterium]|nr:glycosyltransferase [Acidimicrobiales bacterium]
MRPAGAGSGATVGLAMIVKNEAANLPRLAATLDGQLDHWTIVDTGSTDATVSVAAEVFGGVPGEVIEDEWRGYGPSRNVALAAASPHTDWVLTLDADDTLEGSLERAAPAGTTVVEAAYEVPPLSFWVPRLVRSSEPWQWYGRAHEYLALSDGQPVPYRSAAFRVVHHGDGGNRGTKLQRELGLLQADHRDDPANPRTVFYLARTYEDAGEPARAATWYRKRLDLAGWDEETWYARWRLGVCLLASGRTDEGCGVLWSAWGSRPWRAEPLWSLAEHYRLGAQWHLAFEACHLARRHCGVGAATGGGTAGGGDDAEDSAAGGPAPERYGGDRLFVHTDVYDWRMAYEESICTYYVGDRERGGALVAELLGRGDLPPAIVASLEGNRRFYDA